MNNVHIRLTPLTLLLCLLALSCKSEGDGSSQGPAIPEGCPVRGQTIELLSPAGSLFVRDLRFFRSIGDNPVVNAPEGKVFAVVRYVWTPTVPAAQAPTLPPLPGTPAAARPAAAPLPGNAPQPAAQPAATAAQPTAAQPAATAQEAPKPAAATPATPSKAGETAKASALPEKITPPQLQLVDRSGTAMPVAPEALEAYSSMVEADPLATPLPTEFTAVWVFDPAIAENGLYLNTPDTAADGSPVRFCLGKHQISVE